MGRVVRTLRPASSRGGGRIRFGEKEYIDLSSNDYLGLSSHPKIKEAQIEAAERFGASSSASRLLSGDLELHHDLEREIARFKDKEAGLVFNSGYQANIGIIGALCKKGDAIFADRLNHASLVDGALLSGARVFRFQHNDLDHLKSLLDSERDKYGEALIITESVFSMDGDKAPLRELVSIKDKHNCQIMVDEAHATGIFGENGTGLIEEKGASQSVDIIMGTFGKALGGFGAYLVSSKETVDHMINSCRSFIYSTALPPAVIAGNIASLGIVRDEPERRETLLKNADFLRDGLKSLILNVRGSSQIIPIILGDNNTAVTMSDALKDKGYWALPIRPPTVPVGESRLRLSLTYNHSREILEGLIDGLSQAKGL